MRRLDEVKDTRRRLGTWVNVYPSQVDWLINEIDRLEAVVRRLGSVEAFTTARVVDKDVDQELLARIDYAREALT